MSGGQIDRISPTMNLDQPLVFGEAHGAWSDAGLRVERAFGFLVGHQLDGTDEPEAARVSDQRVLAERRKPGLELRRLARSLLGDALTGVDVERLERDRRSTG